jgi:hypothetical protein
MGRFRGIVEVKNVEALESWFKFKEPIRCMYFENTTIIATVICYVVLLGQEIKQQIVGNPILFKIYFVGSKIGDSIGGHDALVAVDIDWEICRTDIIDMMQVGERFTML